MSEVAIDTADRAAYSKAYYEMNKDKLRAIARARYYDKHEEKKEKARIRYYEKQGRPVPPRGEKPKYLLVKVRDPSLLNEVTTKTAESLPEPSLSSSTVSNPEQSNQ